MPNRFSSDAKNICFTAQSYKLNHTDEQLHISKHDSGMTFVVVDDHISVSSVSQKNLIIVVIRKAK